MVLLETVLIAMLMILILMLMVLIMIPLMIFVLITMILIRTYQKDNPLQRFSHDNKLSYDTKG
jgi:heme/copper-type cytochrome/quinol oxidase subunit 2